jgi:predicted MFS family arabinose efflux permease
MNQENYFSESSLKSKYALFLLFFLNCLNFLQRQVIFFLFPLIKESLSLSDFSLGLLGTAFMIPHSVAGLPLGVLADKWIRKSIISLATAFSSLATLLSGFSHSFFQLFTARAFLGISQAPYAPAALSLISDYFPREFRARAISLFAIGGILGSGLGFILGGKLGKAFGWQSTLLIIAFPGFLLSLLAWFLREPSREVSAREDKFYGFPALFKIPLLVNIFFGGACFSFAGGAMIAWFPTFLTRYRGYDLASNEVVLGILFLGIACGGGIFTGGVLADKLLKKRKTGRLITIAAGIFAGSLLSLITLLTPNPLLLFLSIFFATFFFSWSAAPLNTVIQEAVDPGMRARAVAAYLFLIHLGGNIFSPPIIGKLSDSIGLEKALLVLPFIALAGGAIILKGRNYKQD